MGQDAWEQIVKLMDLQSSTQYSNVGKGFDSYLSVLKLRFDIAERRDVD